MTTQHTADEAARIRDLDAELTRLRAELETEREVAAANHTSQQNLYGYAICDRPEEWAKPMSGVDIVIRDEIKRLRERVAGLEEERDCATARAEAAEKVLWRSAAEHPAEFEDGERLLVAVKVHRIGERPYWDYSLVVIEADEGRFAIKSDGEPWAWEWADVKWWMPVSSPGKPTPDAAGR